MSDYSNYAMVLNGVASRTPLPPALWVLNPGDLLSLDWLAAQYGIPLGSQWWPIISQSPPLQQYQDYGDETLTVDAANTQVISTRPVINWTAQQILDYKASITRHITPRAFRNRLTDAEKIALEMAMLDDPAAATEVRHAAAGLRALEKDMVAGPQFDLNLAVNQANVRKLETASIIAAGRADEIIWGDIAPDELP